MAEEIKKELVWDAERILYGYIYHSDDDGYLPNVDSLEDSSYKIRLLRFYAVLRAYGREPEWFYRNENSWLVRFEHSRCLLSKTRSEVKMNEFRELVK